MNQEAVDESKSHILKTKQQIANRNKNNEAINSHVSTLQGGMLGLVIVYKDGTYDKHIINFNKQSYITIISEDKKGNDLIVRYKNKPFRMVPVEGEKNG